MRSQAAHTARAANRRFEKELLSFVLYASILCFLYPLLKKDQEDFKEDFNGKQGFEKIKEVCEAFSISCFPLKSSIKDTKSIGYWLRRKKSYYLLFCMRSF